MTMKILLVNNDKGWGGGQEHLQALAQQLAELGCCPHFLCRAHSPSEQRFAALGFPVAAFPCGGKETLKTILKTAAFFKREKFDIVMVTREHDLFRTALSWELAFPFQKRGKFVMCYHTATKRRQLLLGIADAVVCVSSHVKDRLIAGNRAVASRTSIIGNGIAVDDAIIPEKFNSQRQRRFFHNGGFPLIGMVGAFFKNQGELLEVIPLLRQEFPTLQTIFVGDDGDHGLLAPLRTKVHDRGLSGAVLFTGKVPHERLQDIYFDLDLAVSTFRNEGFGLVHLESLAAGTPVIAYNEGGQVDILAGEEVGILVDGGVEEFAAAIACLLGDNDRRFAMGAKGHALVKRKYSVELMGRNYHSFFLRLLQGECREGSEMGHQSEARD
jgi:glycosyltransferase involved in cell wall biosynthesis